MAVTELRVANYRSIRALSLPLKKANLIVGANGCGKTNLYRSIALLRHAADGRLAEGLLEEGGMPSALWAGDRREGPVRIKLGVTVDSFEYDLEIGLPQPTDPPNPPSLFKLDPVVRVETLNLLERGKRTKILDRNTNSCSIRNDSGVMERFLLELRSEQSVMAQISDPQRFPILEMLRRTFLQWRFYHEFRVDASSPIRQPRPSVRTYVLPPDGSDLAAALGTILENGDDQGLRQGFADAFPESQFEIVSSPGGLELSVSMPGVHRPLRSCELSDGTLRYLCLLAALKSPSPAPLIALNEPENSLHEDLMEPLADLLAQAAFLSQLWVTTHSTRLAELVGTRLMVQPIGLERVDGETVRSGRPRNAAYSSDWDD